jgi:hypothetical protein
VGESVTLHALAQFVLTLAWSAYCYIMGRRHGFIVGKASEFNRTVSMMLDLDDAMIASAPHPGPCHRAHPGRKHVGSPEKNDAGED